MIGQFKEFGKNLMLLIVVAIIAISPASASDGTEEVLIGIKMNSNDLEFTVASGGCTEKNDFVVEVNKGATAELPYLLTIRRVKRDDCKGLDIVVVKFSQKELGLSGAREIRLVNRIGNTSQHR